MRIDGIAGWAPAASGAGPAAHSSSTAGQLREDVDTARTTAMSALNNDRFSRVLDWVSDPRASETAMLMRSDGGGQVDYGTAASRYAENSE